MDLHRSEMHVPSPGPDAAEASRRPVVEATKLTKSYTVDDRHISVLRDIDLSVRAGEFLVIRGSSGSGKTTLLSLLSGLDRPDYGQVRIEGQDITDLSEDKLAPLRNHTFGFVFQSFHLIPSLTALENVMFPAELRGESRAEDQARTLLAQVGLAERSDNFPHQLSGGEMQRVAICRALINHPRIIFADEPTGNLDSRNGQIVLQLLLDFHRERRTTLIMVTHSRDLADLADRVIRLQDGAIQSDREQRHADR
ncbi:MAG TPA: ABC transporter ATP-binding protein [Desulfobacterales bacterium]